MTPTHTRRQLALAFTLGFAVLLLLGGGALYLVLIDGYRQAYDHELVETMALARDHYQIDRVSYTEPTDAVTHIMSELATVHRSLVAFDTGGQRIAMTRRAPAAPDLTHVSLLSAGHKPTTVTMAGTPTRLMRFALSDGIEIVVGVSEDDYAAQVHTLRMALGIGVPVLLLLGALLGMWLADPVLDLHREFLAEAAHEIRTPLAIILSEADAGRATDAPVRMKASLDSIAQEAGRLGSIVSDVLLLARHDAHTPPAQDFFYLDDVAQHAISRARALPESDGRPIVLGEWDEAPTHGDPVLLERAILALIQNALVHASNGPVTVSAGHDHTRSWIRVADIGPGIPPEDRERIFVRGERLLPGRPGSGLGLPIARAIAESHGGGITVGDNQPGAVLTLWVRRAEGSARS